MEPRETPRRRLLLYAAVVTIAFFALLEGGARLVVPPADPTLYETHRNIITILGLPEMNDIMRYDARLFWSLKPGLRSEHIAGSIKDGEMDFAVTTNGLGLRGPEVGPKRGFRVLAVGNSCTFGVGVGDDETWPARLEAILRGQGEDAEVINAGVPGYTSFQGLRYLDERGLALAPDLVIACFGFNDSDAWGPAGDREIAGKLRDRAWDRALSRSSLYRGLARVIRGGKAEEGGDPAKGEERAPRVAADDLYQNLVDMKALCESRGAAMMLLLWPYRKQIREGVDRPVVFQPAILGAGADARIPVIDLIGPFLAAGDRVYLDHIHAGPAGLEIVAEQIASAMAMARVREKN